ncbi:class I adenylate-forming enzyme family protein [Actinomycetospora sp. C-140]
MATLVEELDRHGEESPSTVACAVGDTRATYGELAERVRAFAGAVSDLGLRPGDRVSLFLPNSVDYVVCFYGAMRAGLVANLVNGALTPREVEYMITDSAASLLVTTPELLARLDGELGRPPGLQVVTTSPVDGCVALSELLARPGREVPLPSPSDPACLPYSSGTTGRPKGIVHTHASLSMQAVLSANRLQLRPSDVLVQAMPLVHLYGGNIIMGGLVVAGATMIVQPTFDPAGFARLLADERATACAGVPTTYALLGRLPDADTDGLDVSALEVAVCAGAPLASTIRHRFGERFGAPVLDCYGITEAAGNLTGSLRYGETPTLSCGLPYPMTEIRVVYADDGDVPVGEVGELIARGPQIMAGYWERPEATATTLRGGWLHTGDLARRDEAGFLYIVDRKNDMIITGGYNVYPAEIEEVLAAHPDVALCAAFGVEDPIKGEKPWAAVVPAGGDLDVDALDAWCRERLSGYKVPRRYVLVDDIPRSSVGKLLRRELRAQFSPAAGPPASV